MSNLSPIKAELIGLIAASIICISLLYMTRTIIDEYSISLLMNLIISFNLYIGLHFMIREAFWMAFQ